MKSFIQSVKEALILIKSITLVTAGILFLCALPFVIYSALDENGQISHSVETSISAKENWLVGESKDCTSPVVNAKTAQFIGQDEGYVAMFVTCDEGPQHTITVKFYGQMNQPAEKLITWRCTRETEGFTCKQKGVVH